MSAAGDRLAMQGNGKRVYDAIAALNAARRTTNNSQIASRTGLSRASVAEAARALRTYGFIENQGKGAAYHWRITGKRLPCPERHPEHRAPCIAVADHDGSHRDRHGCTWPEETEAEWQYGNSPAGLRQRAAEELAAEFGTDVSEWLV